MTGWKDVLVPASMPIRKVIKTIDDSSMQIALVVDASQKLLGVVTDGDVRRGILKGISLEDPVKRIMASKPATARIDDDEASIIKMMRQQQIHHVPVLDPLNRIVDMHVLDELMADHQPRDNWVVLMVGGLGTRLKPLTDQMPKFLLNVGKKPIAETILNNFIQYGFKKFIFCVNYKGDMVRQYFGDGSRWGVSILYLNETQRLGTAGALTLLPKKTNAPFLVMNGDLLTKVNFGQLCQFHSHQRSAATVCVREYDFQVPYGVVRLKKQSITGIDEKPVNRFFVNAGIYVLEPRVLKYLPKNRMIDMPQLFNKLIQKKMRVTAFPVREYWLDIGKMDDYERANGEFSKFFESL